MDTYIPKQEIKVLHINTYDRGGAAIACIRLHQALLRNGIDSKLLTLHKTPHIKIPQHYIFYECKRIPKPKLPRPSIIYRALYKFKILKSRQVKNAELMRRRNDLIFAKSAQIHASLPEKYELFSLAESPHDITQLEMFHQANIINLHWTAELMDMPSFFAGVENRKIVWTLHDMNLFTGGCHYSHGCEKFKDACKSCPQLVNYPDADEAYRNQEVKVASLKNKEIHIVGDSNWLEKEARASRVLQNVASFRTIHYGVDTELFRPIDRTYCKKVFGIDPDTFTISFGAADVNNWRKGIAALKSSLQKLQSINANICCLIFGKNMIEWPIKDVLPPVKFLGEINSPYLQSVVYSASDIFVIPSLYEAFGQTALEAMACNTPVVGFDTGGIPDMIYPYITGLLAKVGDADDLAEKIKWMIDHSDQRMRMGENARQLVLKSFNFDLQANNYIQLYNSILD